MIESILTVRRQSIINEKVFQLQKRKKGYFLCFFLPFFQIFPGKYVLQGKNEGFPKEVNEEMLAISFMKKASRKKNKKQEISLDYFRKKRMKGAQI